MTIDMIDESLFSSADTMTKKKEKNEEKKGD